MREALDAATLSGSMIGIGGSPISTVPPVTSGVGAENVLERSLALSDVPWVGVRTRRPSKIAGGQLR